VLIEMLLSSPQIAMGRQDSGSIVSVQGHRLLESTTALPETFDV
jgi:hypothetical protein